MRKRITLLLLLVLSVLCASASAETPMAGHWYLAAVTTGGTVMSAADLNMTIELTVNDDGTAVMTNDGLEISCSWNGTAFVVDGTAGTASCTGDSLILSFAAQDSNAAFTMTFSRQEQKGFTPALSVKADDISQFNGEFTAYYIGSEGVYVSIDSLTDQDLKDQFGTTDMCMTVKNGAVSLLGIQMDDFTLTEDGVLSLTVVSDDGSDDTEPYDITITLLEDGTEMLDLDGLKLYFR